MMSLSSMFAAIVFALMPTIELDVSSPRAHGPMTECDGAKAQFIIQIYDLPGHEGTTASALAGYVESLSSPDASNGSCGCDGEPVGCKQTSPCTGNNLYLITIVNTDYMLKYQGTERMANVPMGVGVDYKSEDQGGAAAGSTGTPYSIKVYTADGNTQVGVITVTLFCTACAGAC